MIRLIALLSGCCYLAACLLPAVIVPNPHGFTLRGLECLAFLPFFLRGGPGGTLLLLAWLANPAYVMSLLRAAMGKRGHNKFAWIALGCSLGFPAYLYGGATFSGGQIQTGPGCLLWYLSMFSLAIPLKQYQPDSESAQMQF